MTDLDDRLRAGITALAEREQPEATTDEVLARLAAGTSERRPGARRGSFMAAAAVLAAIVLVAAVVLVRRSQGRAVDVGPSSSSPTTSTATSDVFPAGLHRWGTGPVGSGVGGSPIWDGREVVVIGGDEFSGTDPYHVAALDPSTHAWRRLPPLPFVPGPPEERGVEGAACGNQVLVWTLDGQAAILARDGTAWRSLPRAPHVAFDALGGPILCDGPTVLFPANGRSLSLTTYVWRTLAAPPAAGTNAGAVVWTGSEAVVELEVDGTGTMRSLAAYDPASNTWRMLSSPPFDVVGTLQLTWTGDRVVAMDGIGHAAKFDPATNRWTTLPDVPNSVIPPGFGGGASELLTLDGRAAVIGLKGDAILGTDGIWRVDHTSIVMTSFTTVGGALVLWHPGVGLESFVPPG